MSSLKKYITIGCVSALVFSNIAGAQTIEETPARPSPVAIAATGKITGKVVDASNNSPLDFANVALIRNSDKKVVKSTHADTTGTFIFDNIQTGTYTLRISFIGYKPFSKSPINLNSGSVLSLGTLKLSSTGANVLQEVVVEGKRNTIQLGIDRKVFNVEQSLVSEGGSATDLLANIPSVSVDIDGNVSLRGAGNVRILIDGKPSALAGSDISQALQSIPASSIQNIELVTNPSSKYDAEGQAGIINIVLKKNQKAGINGSLALSAGTQDNYNASANFNYRNNKWNLYGNYGFRVGNRLGGGFNNTSFLLTDSVINNNSDSRRNGLSNTAKVGFDYSPNDKTSIGLSANISVRDNNRDENLSYEYFKFLTRTGSSYRTSEQDEIDNGYDLNLDFSRKFKRKGEELTANISYGNSKEDGIQHLNQNFFLATGYASGIRNSRTNDTYEDGDNVNIQLDYTLPINDRVKIEAGYRTSIRNNQESQVSDTLDLNTNAFLRDYSLTNDFNLEDIVHAAYANYQNQLTKSFGFQVGLRAEQAYLNTDLTAREGANSAPVTTPGRLDYFRIYPSIFLTQKIKGENQLQLSYTRRVNRPRGWQVNPFRDISDPNNIRMGNPNLKPEDIHAMELSYMKYWKNVTLTSSVYFRQVNDVVEGVRLPLTDENAATITQFFNISRRRATGFELISRADVSRSVSLTGNLNVYYNNYAGFSVGDYTIGGSDGYNWDANLTSDIKLPQNLSAQIRMGYMAPQVTPQGRRREMYGMDAALRKDIMNRKASISLNVQNILNSRKWGGITETNTFISDFERMWQKRMANLTFSYRFGKQDFQRNRKNRDQQERGEQPDEGMF